MEVFFTLITVNSYRFFSEVVAADRGSIVYLVECLKYLFNKSIY